MPGILQQIGLGHFYSLMVFMSLLSGLAGCTGNVAQLPDRVSNPHSQDDAYYAELANAAPDFELDITALKVAAPEERKQLGVWSEVIRWPHVPVSAAQLPDGRVLTWASFNGFHFNKAWGGRDYTVAVSWDPATATFSDLPNPAHDMFCAHQVLLEDGRLLVSGGNYKDEVSLFDYRTNSWIKQPKLQRVRWYPTSVAMPDGSVFIALGAPGDKYPELWTEAKGWSFLPGIDFTEPILNFKSHHEQNWWPLLNLAPNGKLFHSGPTPTMHYISTEGHGSIERVGSEMRDWYPKDGITIMYDEAKLLVAGGAARPETGPPDAWGDPSLPESTNKALIIDISEEEPKITRIAAMKYSRKFHNGVILPNGEVMVIGGNTKGDKFFDDSSVMTPELWNPKTQTWRELADISVPRNYHSVGLLLTDGRVLSGGGGLCGPTCSKNHPDIQVFSPPYLFNADGSLAERPVISQAPASIAYGAEFEVQASANVTAFSLIKMSSTTHQINTDLRFLWLPFRKTAVTSYRLQAHSNPNVLSPGFWMLFALDDKGVPSVSQLIQVSSSLPNLVSPGNQSNALADTVDITVQAFNPQGGDLYFGAEGLPDGLSIDRATGKIHGQLLKEGQFKVRIWVTNSDNKRAELSFTWLVSSTPLLVLEDLKLEAQEVNKVITYKLSYSGGSNPRFKWHFGDASPETPFSASPLVSHTFSRPGRYVLTLTASDDTGIEISKRFVQAIHEPLKEGRASSSSSLIIETYKGLERLWSVNPDNNSVSVFAAKTRQKLAEIPVGTNPRSLVAVNDKIWVTNKDSSSLSIIDIKELKLEKTLDLAYASRPHGIVFDSLSQTAYIALEALGQVLKLDAQAKIIARLELSAELRHLALSADGQILLAPRFISAAVPGEATAKPDLANAVAELYVILTRDLRLQKTLLLAHSNRQDAEHSARGIPNYLAAPAISPDGLSVWLASKQDNIARGVARDGHNLSFESTVRAITSYIDWTTGQEIPELRIDLDNAGVASAALFSPKGNYLFVSLETNRQVAVIDAYARQELFRFEVDRAPQGLALAADGRYLYVHNFMERSISVHDLSGLLELGELDIERVATMQTVAEEHLSAEVLLGKQLFYDAKDPRLALDSYLSCASCHADGGHDGRTWDFTGFGEGLRNTASLVGKAGATQARLHWTGNFDEVQDFEAQIRALAAGQGLMEDADFFALNRQEALGEPKAGLSQDLDALAAYVNSLREVLASPYRDQKGLSEEALAGKRLFEEAHCSSCHQGELFGDNKQHRLYNIGTLKALSGQRLGKELTGLQAPSLKAVWATAPYLHDGSAATLEEAVSAHETMVFSASEVQYLSRYLQELDGLEPAPALPQLLRVSDATPKNLLFSTVTNVPALQLRLSSHEPVEVHSMVLRLSRGKLSNITDLNLRLISRGTSFDLAAEPVLPLQLHRLSEENRIELILTSPLSLNALSSQLLVLTMDLTPAAASFAVGSSLTLIVALALLKRRRLMLLLLLSLLLAACTQTTGLQYQFVLEEMHASYQGQALELSHLPLEGQIVSIAKR